MREGYGSCFVCVCVCLCVCYHTNCYIPNLYVEIKVVLSFLCHFLHMHCVHFVENALFRSYGDINLLTTSAFFAFLTDFR